MTSPDRSESNAEVAKALIDAGTDVNAQDEEGNTPLHNARNAKVAKALIDAGADVNALNDSGNTPPCCDS